MAFQAQQAPNYQGAASDMGGHLASMGKANMTYALAKRARDEKRADIKLQKEKDERSYILGNIREGLGIMRENTLLKREDKQKAQIQENWKSLEPERISKLHNSLNKEWSIEYAQKQRELNAINKGREENLDDPIPMSEFLRTNPLIAKRHTLAEAAQRYHGGIGGEEAGVLKETAVQGDPEADEELKLAEANAERQARADASPMVFEAETPEEAQRISDEREGAGAAYEQEMQESREARYDTWLKSTEKGQEGKKTSIIGRAEQKKREAVRKHKQKQDKEAEAKKERQAMAQEVVAKSKDKRERQDAYKKAEAAAQRKREEKAYQEHVQTLKEQKADPDSLYSKRQEAKRKAKREKAAKRIVTGSQMKRKVEKKAERKADEERKAVAQETVETSKRKRKAESIMEKIKQEKAEESAIADRRSSESRSRRQQTQLGEKQAEWGKTRKQDAAGTSIREEAAAADDKLVQQFKTQAGEYEGVREKEKKGKENDNREAAANKDVWGKDQIKKYYTKERDGNFLPSAEAMKDDPNAEKKPLSHWIEQEDTDDGGEWEGVTKNPVQFFLKNPDKLKNLSTNNRKTMLKKMGKYFEDTKTKKGYKPWAVTSGKSPSERIIEE